MAPWSYFRTRISQGGKAGSTAMLKNLKIDLGLVFAVVLFGMCGAGALSRLAAQGATATILGTVTDSSGSAIPEASVQVKNVGTGITQSTTADGQGRFSVP